jgi:hypothetical protein
MLKRKGYLIASILLCLLALGCIGTTTVEIIRQQYVMSSWNFWGAVIFHAVVMMLAGFVFGKARSVTSHPQKEDA